MPHRLRWPAFLLGFSLGGFADGIMLHQVLQWHHLLSLWARPDDFAFQSFWDGMFHVAHYLIAAGALAALWQRREAAAVAGAGRVLAGWAMLGFGAWHVVDVVGVHWIIAMHRTRLGVENPLAYDLGLLAIGLVALAIGWAILRRPGRVGGSAVAATLALATLVSAPVAALPPPQPDPAVAELLRGRALPAFCGAWTRLVPG